MAFPRPLSSAAAQRFNALEMRAHHDPEDDVQPAKRRKVSDSLEVASSSQTLAGKGWIVTRLFTMCATEIGEKRWELSSGRLLSMPEVLFWAKQQIPRKLGQYWHLIHSDGRVLGPTSVLQEGSITTKTVDITVLWGGSAYRDSSQASKCFKPSAFAAIKSDGSVVTWGGQRHGGDSSAVADLLRDRVVQVTGTNSAFAAIKNDGSVVTWGDQRRGGDSSAVANLLQDGVANLLQDGVANLLRDGVVQIF